MGLFDFLFKRAPKPKGEYEGEFRLLTGYAPKFTRHGESIYESELVRSAIDARATHISKLKVEIIGSAKPSLRVKLEHAPNQFQTWSQFLYRLSTILDIHNTAFICPVYDDFGEPSGIYAPLPDRCELVQYKDVPYLRYEFSHGKKAAIELEFCGIMTRHQYKNDLFGENNRALIPTMDLIKIQQQGIEEGVNSAASFRFMAQVNNFARPEDLKKERERFTEYNLTRDTNKSGFLLFPNTYTNIQQISNKPFVVDAETMKIIKDTVYGYFGVNEDVLFNKAYGDAWAAFYEGAIEPFAIQFSEVLTKMLYTFREQSQGNMIMATANRLQYLSNKEKLNVTAQMLDRGLFTLNEAREIWNLSPVDGGDVRIIRGEYYNADKKTDNQVIGEDNNGEGN